MFNADDVLLVKRGDLFYTWVAEKFVNGLSKTLN